MYLDGKGFEFKTNLLNQACAPSAWEWRQRGEGLLCFGRIAKWKKEVTTCANLMVGISHGHDVVCRQYYGQITGEKFSHIVESK